MTTNNTTDNIRKVNRIPNNERDYFEDGNHNIFLDSWGKNPLFCKDCHVQQRCDLEGKLYCPQDGLKEKLPIEIKSILNPNPLVSNTNNNLPKNYVQPLATQLHSTERILWKHIKTKGFWHKRIVEAMEITNEAVIYNDTRIPWSSITDVLVMNSRNMGVGYHAGSFGGRYSRTYSGFSNYNSVQIGSVVFMQGSTVACVFNGIHHPSGLVRLCKSIMKANKNIMEGMNLTLRLT